MILGEQMVNKGKQEPIIVSYLGLLFGSAIVELYDVT